MKDKIVIRRVADISKVCESLTKHVNDWWGLAHTNWKLPVYFWWVAFRGDEWLAYGALSWRNSEDLYAGPAFCKEEARGLGLQLRLLKCRKKYAKMIGAKRIVSSTDCNNIWSSNNLIKCGFKLTKPFIETHGLYWSLDL